MKVVIYSIQNKMNNKVYVGSSKEHTRRLQTHFYHLRKGIHANEHLQRSYDKYGKDNFIVSILEECNVDNRWEREVFWINHFQSHLRDKGYNIFEPNEEVFKCSEETIHKLKNSTKCHPIDCYDLELNFITTYPSIREAARDKNATDTLLREILKDKRKSYKGFTYCYAGETCNYKPSRMQRNMKAYYNK